MEQQRWGNYEHHYPHRRRSNYLRALQGRVAELF